MSYVSTLFLSVLCICLLLLLLRCFLSIRSVVFCLYFSFIFYVVYLLLNDKYSFHFFSLYNISLPLFYSLLLSMCFLWPSLILMWWHLYVLVFLLVERGLASSPHESPSLRICYFVFNSQSPMYLSDILILSWRWISMNVPFGFGSSSNYAVGKFD